MKSYIGIGILSLPYSFFETGWLLATILLVLMGFAVC
jgi:amino acid permease